MYSTRLVNLTEWRWPKIGFEYDRKILTTTEIHDTDKHLHEENIDICFLTETDSNTVQRKE